MTASLTASLALGPRRAGTAKGKASAPSRPNKKTSASSSTSTSASDGAGASASASAGASTKAAQPAAEEAASTELQQRVSKKHDQVQHRRPLTRVCFGPEDHAGCGWEVYGGAMAPAEGGKGE